MKRSIVTLLAAAVMAVTVAFAQAPADTYVYQTFGEIASLDPARAYDSASG